MRVLLSLALIAGAAACLRADEATPVRAFRDFDHKSQPGLPASSVMDLYQDREGVLWLATLDGLASFDGETLVGVTATDAPRVGALRSIAPRPDGGFYVGGSSRLYVYDSRNWRVLPADDGADSLAALDAELWRLDRRGHLTVLTDEKPPWQPIAPPAGGGNPVSLEEAGGELYLATADGVWRRNEKSWERQGEPVEGAVLTALLRSRDGSLWVGTDSPFLLQLPSGAAAWRRLPLPGWQGGRVRALTEDLHGRIWAGGLQGGLAFGREEFTLWGEPNGLHRDGILALLADREGSLWISLNGHGLQQWLGESWTHRNRWKGEPGNPRYPVFGITPDSGEGFYAAVFSRGIWHWDGRRMEELGRESGLSEDVRQAYEPAPGELWVSARYGIFERRGDGRFVQTLFLPGGFVYGIVAGPGGRHFALTSATGIYERIGTGWQPVEAWNSKLPSTNVRALLFRPDGTVYVGTFGGLKIFGPQGGLIEPGEAWSMVPEAINALLEVDGEVWIAGYGGLAICRDTASPCRLMDPAQLPGKTYYSLARTPDGAVWMGGAAGVGRFFAGQWTIYDAGSGLIEDECNHLGLLTRPDGQVLLGTMASLARYEPRTHEPARPPLEVFWTERPRPGSDGVARRSPEARALTLSWRAPWLLPRQLEYRVRVPRSDDQWLAPQKENFRHFVSLGPGEWEVEVAARRLPGGEWTQPIVTSFLLEPRFHETRFFKVLCGVALLFAVAGLVHWRTRSLARRAAELQRAVEAQVASLKTLHGLLPICASCKKIRDDRGYWQQLESYLREHSEAELSHGFCPECFQRITSALDAAHDRPGKPQ